MKTWGQLLRVTNILYIYPFLASFLLQMKWHFNMYMPPLLAHLSRRLTGELVVNPCSGDRPSVRRPSVRPSFTILKIFFSV